jgi:WD40 repeat protein
VLSKAITTFGSKWSLILKFFAASHFYATPNDSNQQCLGDLRVTDPRSDRARIRDEGDELLRGCYAWVLGDENFKRWQVDRESRLLWIKGDPGKGKTMMTIGLVDELSKFEPSYPVEPAAPMLDDDSTPLLSYFFCQDTNPVLNNAASVLRGLIYMLAVQRESLLQYVQKEYVIAGRQLFEGHNAIYSLRGILSNMLNDASLPQTYLLVDALDECTSGLSDLLKIITDDSIGRQSKVKWLLTSRNTPVIKQYLQPDSQKAKVSLEVKSEQVSTAVAAYVKYKVQRLAAVQLYDGVLQADVQKQLRDKAGGTFLWVSLVCKELMSVPFYRTREVLQGLPPGLGPLYTRMIAKIETQDTMTVRYCSEILKSTTLALRPLQIWELVVMASLPSDQFCNVQAVLDLVSRCGSFLTVREGIVSFIHLSAKDYFTLGDGRRVLGATPEEEQKRIAVRLLDAMGNMLRRDICNLRTPGVPIQEAVGKIHKSCLSRIGYACEYWVQHVQACGQASSGIMADDGKVHSFLRAHLLHWLEAMSLLQKMPDALAAIQRLFSIPSVSRDLMILYGNPAKPFQGTKSISLSGFIHDAVRFAMRGGPGIQVAPLQVYCSALVFAPKKSLVRQSFAQEMPSWIANIFGLDEEWGPLWQTLEGHAGLVTSVAFSANGDRLASGSYDKTVRIWDAKTGQPIHTLEGHTGPVSGVTFLAAVDLLVSASHDKTLRVWDAKTGKLLDILERHTDCITDVAFSAARQQLASASHDKTVSVWDTKTWNWLYTLNGHTSYVTSVAFSAPGDRLASASEDGMVCVWNTITGDLLHNLRGHTDRVTSVRFSLEGDRLASASDDRTIRIWNVKSGRLLHTLRGHTLSVTSVAFSPVGDLLASASQGGTVRLWNTAEEETLRSLEGHTGPVTSVAFSQHGEWLASASADYNVHVWDIKSPKTSQSDKGHTRYVHDVAFSPRGELLASGSEDRTVRIWDANTGTVLRTLEGHPTSVHSVSFSAAGDLLASASFDGTVRVWRVVTGHPVQKLKYTGWVGKVAFSDCGLYLVTEQGWWLLPSPGLSASPVTHQSLAQRIFVTDRWLAMGSEEMLWIPANFEPTCTAFRSNRVALGYSSGKVIFLESS